jgi:peptide/nickel transport system substrate-binding protein
VERVEATTGEEVISTDFTTRLTERWFQAVLVEIEYFGDPDPYHLWHQAQIEAGQNIGGWDNTTVSIVLEEARLTVDQGQRIQYYYTFQEIFAEEQPALILYYPVYSYGVRNTVKGVEMSTITNPADRFQNITEWYLLTQRIIETSNSPGLSSRLEGGN